MSDRTRNRINAVFDDELSAAPVPPSLRALSVRAAIAAPRPRSRQPELLALVAAVLVAAIVATLVIGTHILRSSPVPAKPAGSLVPPPPTANAASAFDARHGELVIFGGSSGPGANPPTNATWTWDGKYWRHLHPAVSPSARSGAVMAYDAARGDIVLTGGAVAAKTSRGCCQLVPVGDTWTWNGVTWLRRHPTNQPTLESTDVAYDPVTKKVLLFGFSIPVAPGTTGAAELWSWNGSDWQKLSTPVLPTSPATFVTDGQRLLMLVMGMSGGRYVTQSWAWGGDGWAVLKPSANLPPVGTVSSAYDPGRHQLVLVTGDTWTWDGYRWTRQHPTLQPQGAGYMGYVPSLHEVVSWGDRTASLDNEMFGWDGSDWKLIAPGTAVWPANDGKGSLAERMSPDQAAAIVRATVKNTHPVLLPAFLPSGGPYDAFVSVTADDFNITYESDLRDKTITICICAANPPPATGPNAKNARVRFRNAAPLKFGASGYADYTVYDTTSPASMRNLTWLEPGSTTNAMDFNGGVYYFLSATGLTDQEFWQVANSLQ